MDRIRAGIGKACTGYGQTAGTGDGQSRCCDLFGTQMIVMIANAFVMSNSVAGAICASTMIFIVPRRKVVVSEALIDKAGEEEQGML